MEWAHYAQGGFSPLNIKAASAEDPYTYKVKKNDLHTLAASSLHEYVVVGEEENARKWATMNVGASSEKDEDGSMLYLAEPDIEKTACLNCGFRIN